MTTKGRQWAELELPIDDVRTHRDLQCRVGGLDQANVNRIRRVLASGKEARDPIRVARVGKALYVVDGHHRLEAYRSERRATVPAKVAKMGLEEAKREAEAANAANGKSLTRSDKEALWQAFVAEGRHLDDVTGTVRASWAIAADLHGLWSHETIRKKLKAAGVEMDVDVEYGGDFKPYGPSEEQLEQERLEEAEDAIGSLGALLVSLDALNRRRLIDQTRKVLDAVERGDERGRQEALKVLRDPLDI